MGFNPFSAIGDVAGLSLPPAQVADLTSVISRLTAEQQAKIVRIT
ncbi:MAG TPA: hypothetical protein VN325_10615 [Steroidobacteraceae bacterium]|jgi:hypothetical protein|nr:hypothetical protein [Steroidobacteraceae bacterium]